jgi:hypothetical protein
VPKPEMEFFDPSNIPHQQVGGVQGLSEQVLSRDEVTGNYTRVLHFEPGTDTSAMGVQVHDFWEEVWVLEGSLFDINLQETFGAGMYACRPPGMPHGPWRSVDGCKTLEFRYFQPHSGR